MACGTGTLHGGLEGRRYRAQNCKQAGEQWQPEGLTDEVLMLFVRFFSSFRA